MLTGRVGFGKMEQKYGFKIDALDALLKKESRQHLKDAIKYLKKYGIRNTK